MEDKNKKILENNKLKLYADTENLYKNICQKYVASMLKEMLIEVDNGIRYIFVADEYIELKQNGKINETNYKQYLDTSFGVGYYDDYKEIFDAFVMDGIRIDINDLGLFDEKNNWDFYITFDELKKIDLGYMVQDYYPFLVKYAVPEEKIFDFFQTFSLEELNNFEHTLQLYYKTENLVIEGGTLVSIDNTPFNLPIIELSEGMINYEDFKNNYEKKELTYYDLALPKVIEYFKENSIEDLMEYGSDRDEGLTPMSSMYKEIMDKLNIKYANVFTQDISDGKYVTTVIFEDETTIIVDTDAFNGIDVVAQNIESVLEKYEKIKENIQENQDKNEIDFDY